PVLRIRNAVISVQRGRERASDTREQALRTPRRFVQPVREGVAQIYRSSQSIGASHVVRHCAETLRPDSRIRASIGGCVEDAVASPDHRLGIELISETDARPEVVPFGIILPPAIPVYAGVPDAAVQAGETGLRGER